MRLRLRLRLPHELVQGLLQKMARRCLKIELVDRFKLFKLVS